MRIEDNRLQPVRYVDGGDVFEYNKRKYIRLSIDSRNPFNAVDIEDGELTTVDDDEYVQVLRSAVLCIE